MALASLLKPPYLLPTSTSTERSTRLSGRTIRLLEEGLDELHFWIVRVRADDDGLLNLSTGVGRQRDSESFASQRPADIGRQALPVAPVVDPYHNLASSSADL